VHLALDGVGAHEAPAVASTSTRCVATCASVRIATAANLARASAALAGRPRTGIRRCAILCDGVRAAFGVRHPLCAHRQPACQSSSRSIEPHRKRSTTCVVMRGRRSRRCARDAGECVRLTSRTMAWASTLRTRRLRGAAEPARVARAAGSVAALGGELEIPIRAGRGGASCFGPLCGGGEWCAFCWR
jgi:hypothetical protein